MATRNGQPWWKGHCPMNNPVIAQATHKQLSAYEWQPASHELFQQEKSAIVNMQVSLVFQIFYVACRVVCSIRVMMPCSVKRVTMVPTTSTWPCLEWRDNSRHHSKSKCSRSISSSWSSTFLILPIQSSFCSLRLIFWQLTSSLQTLPGFLLSELWLVFLIGSFKNQKIICFFFLLS